MKHIKVITKSKEKRRKTDTWLFKNFRNTQEVINYMTERGIRILSIKEEE